VKFRLLARPFVATLLLVLGILAISCGDGNEEEVRAAPEPGASWDYVALGDSTPAGFGVGTAYVGLYASYIEADLGVTVTVHDWATGAHRTTADWLKMLRTNQELRDDLSEAEVITLWLGWHDVLPSVGTAGNDGQCIKGEVPDLDCIREVVAPMEANFDAILAEIVALSSPTDALIRIADTANPFVGEWQELGIFEELRGPAFEDWRNYLEQSAEEYNVSVVHSYRVLNGPNGDEAGATEYMQPDGLHINAEGHKLLADLHRDVGYKYAAP
jgi:lysophospholipase L1-like esterase